MIRVLLGPPATLVCAALERAIRASESLEFAGTVDPHNFSSDFSGDILMLDVAEPNEQDWQVLADLPIPVIALLDSADYAVAGSALRAGIQGVISSDATAQEIEGAVHGVNAGFAVMPRNLLAELLQDGQSFGEELAEPLSGRELEVLDLLAEGLSNKLIAHRLSISEHTVKTHVASIFGKLGSSSRTEAVSQAIRRGLIML
ncbi:MAG: response regulator transcription factor [Bryobacterales bacterium]|nr:response regulator transcription factor [Bryobacterales bacterium]